MRKEHKASLRSIVSGASSAYGGYTLFALVITYVVRFEPWTEGGLDRVLHHILVSGTYAALMAAAVVPLGYWIGFSGRTVSKGRPRLTYIISLLALAVLWSLGRITG